jgi:drug/metabolite transporter (DMT)-like permease
MANTSGSRAVGATCGIGVIALFSSFTLVSRLGLRSSLKPIDIAVLRFTIGGLLLLPVLLKHRATVVRRRDAAALALFGGLGFAMLAYTGFSMAPASHGAVLLHGTLPLWTFALARSTGSAETSRGRVLGVASIFIGIVAMAWDSVATSTPRQWLGDIALLLAAASWSAYGLLARRLDLKPSHAAAIVAVLSMVSYFPVYWFLPNKALFSVSWHELLVQALFQGVLIGAVSIFIYTRAVATLGAVETALFTAAVPSVTTLAAVFLLHESPSHLAMSGVAVVTIGMAIALKG